MEVSTLEPKETDREVLRLTERLELVERELAVDEARLEKIQAAVKKMEAARREYERDYPGQCMHFLAEVRAREGKEEVAQLRAKLQEAEEHLSAVSLL